MRRTAGMYAGHEAIAHAGVRLTFAEAWERGVRLANGLLDLGLQSGDRVGVLEGNSLGAADAFVGMAAANLVRVPLYPRNSREAHAHMLGHTGCRALLVTAELAPTVAGLEDSLPALEHVLVRDDTYEAWLGKQSPVDPDPAVSPDDWYIIRHTAGTTGLSKGVAYSHRSWLAGGRDWFYPFPPVDPGDRCLHLGPISHGSGYLFTPTWLSGGSNVMVDSLDPDAVLSLMESDRIAYVFMVPTLLGQLARHPGARDRDWSGLKVINVGGAPISDDTALLARDVFGEVLYQTYGQTEALPAAGVGPREWFSTVEGSEPLRSAGRPHPFVDVEIRGDDGLPVPTGEEGEIALRTDGQMTAFWENPEATAERLVDGFVLTGDIGRLDHNGFLYVLDRKNDMIISGAYNIYPAELENALMDHPAVIEAAVFGVPHDRWGETPRAVCTVDPAHPVTPEELIALCSERLGSYKKPSVVELVTTPLPRTPVGKLDRKALREPHWAGLSRRVAGT